MTDVNDSSNNSALRGDETLDRRVAELTRQLARSQAAERAAREAIERQSQGIIRLAHDLRNPISGMRAAVESTLQTILTSDQRRDLEIVRRTADGALDLVDTLMELPQAGTDPADVEHREFSVDDLLSDVILASTPSARSKGLTLTSHRASDVPTRLISDPRRLRRILSNLVGNAIKFTEHGKITVRTRFDTDETMAGHLYFMVEDTGIGIAVEDQAAIFESFRQVHRALRTEGMGLGLSICQELTRELAGQIWVESELGRGSRFHVKVPATAPSLNAGPRTPSDRHDPTPPQLSAGPSLRILLAEDCEVNQMVAAGLLGTFGHVVDIATNGQEAIAAVESSQYDAVLMDLEMPDLDGTQAARSLRTSDKWTSRHVPIIGITAHIDPRVRHRCLNAGMDACLSKPLDPEQLAQTLTRLTRRRQWSSEPASPVQRGPHESSSGRVPRGHPPL